MSKCIYAIDNLPQDSFSFISKQKRVQEDKIAERPRESEGERASVGL